MTRGGSRISGKGVSYVLKCGVLTNFKYPIKMILFCLTETKLYHFHRIFKNGRGGGGGVEHLKRIQQQDRAL